MLEAYGSSRNWCSTFVITLAVVAEQGVENVVLKRRSKEFVESVLPKFKIDNPQLEVVTELHRGRHPHFKGYFANKNERVVDVKNLSSEEVALQAMRLRNSTGRKVVKLKTRHVTFRPSVQGTWTPDIKF